MKPEIKKSVVTTVFQCSGCGSVYKSLRDAQTCANSDEFNTHGIKVGDFVTAGGFRFGWYDGSKDWVIKRNCAPTEGPPFKLIYVVTAITQDSHKIRFHLVTGAMGNGYDSGWTSWDGHLRPAKLDKEKLPLGVQAAGAALIGRTSTRLL